MTNSRNTVSGGFIKDASVLVGRVGDAAKNVLGLFEALGGYYDDVDGISDVSQRPPDTDTLLASVRRVRLHDQQIDVAIAVHVSRGGGSEEDDPIGRGGCEDPPHRSGAKVWSMALT